MEKVGFDNFFHCFHELLRKSLESKKSKPTFSTTQAVLEAQIVEKIVFEDFFHWFHELLRKSWNHKNGGKSCHKQLFPPFSWEKNFLRNSWKKWKKLSKPTFSMTQAVLEAQIVEKVVFSIIKMVEKVAKNNFFHHFRGKKNFLRNSWKKWKKLSKPTFSTSQAVLEAQIVEKVGFDNFFHHFYDSKDFLRNSWKKWIKLAWPTFSTTISIAFGG